MTKPIARDPMDRRRSFDADMIGQCFRWYITYRLSYRDLVAMMAERDVEVSHTTILRWVVRFVPEFEKRWNRHARRIGSSWRVDETYIAIRGKWHHLYRAVGEQGKSVDFLLRRDRGIARVLQKGAGDGSYAMAAQAVPGWSYSESPRTTAAARGESEVELRGGAQLQVPQQHR